MIYNLKDISPPLDDQVKFLPEPGGKMWNEAYSIGLKACSEGKVGVVILNGGMATRFSGVVKGVEVDVWGHSFLYWKLKQLKKVSSALQIFIMNSEFTNEKTVKHLEEIGKIGEGVDTFIQQMFPRETETGEIFTGEDGKPSMAGGGHGDIFESFQKSGMLEKFLKSGGKVLMISNVDNLGAMLDPLMIGMHLNGMNDVTIEVTWRKPSYVGGILVSAGGCPLIIENLSSLGVTDLNPFRFFNTNTFYFNSNVLMNPPELQIHNVVKYVKGIKVIQKEKILCEITHFIPSQFLVVQDEGINNRFIPVKTPQQLNLSLEAIKLVLCRWGIFE